MEFLVSGLVFTVLFICAGIGDRQHQREERERERIRRIEYAQERALEQERSERRRVRYEAEAQNTQHDTLFTSISFHSSGSFTDRLRHSSSAQSINLDMQ